MPEKNEKPKQRNKVLDESMQRAYSKVSGEMPDVKRVGVNPREASLFTRAFMPRGANAVTNPFTGNVAYNPNMMEGSSPEDMEQIMAHELTHVRQVQDKPWYGILGEIFSRDLNVPSGVPSSLNNPYYWQPREMEAFQTERNRAGGRSSTYQDPMTGARDIILPSPRKKNKIDTGPTSEYMQNRLNREVNLNNDTKRKFARE